MIDIDRFRRGLARAAELDAELAAQLGKTVAAQIDRARRAARRAGPTVQLVPVRLVSVVTLAALDT